MRHFLFEEANSYNIAILVKGAAFKKQEIMANYVLPLNSGGVVRNTMIAFSLKYDVNGKAGASFIKDYLNTLLPALDSLGVKILYVTDSNYFKTITKQAKADIHLGYVLPCKIKGYEHMQVVLGINYQALIFNPALQSKLDQSLTALGSLVQGNYQPVGTGIIHSSYYPKTLQDIQGALDALHQHPSLTCDIEAFSLRFNEAGIGTIAFAWDEHNGLAFACDCKQIWDDRGTYDRACEIDIAAYSNFEQTNHAVRQMLCNFFTSYQGELIFHNATYDVKVIIYTLWMKDLLDTEGLLLGLETMTRRFHDTKITAYLATNSTAGNVLGLKALAQEFAGNWAQDDIKDIRRIVMKDLLQYNLVDALSTWYVKKKFTPRMIQDQQEELYRTLMLPSLKTIIQMELTGMAMDPVKIQEVRDSLWREQDTYLTFLKTSPLIKLLNLVIQTSAMQTANAKLKVKQHPLEKFSDVCFNPNSGPQLQRLLYEQMGLPILDYTDTKQPATGAETIGKLINHTTVPAYKALLEALVGYGKVSKILSTFIPAFERGIDKEDGMKYLHGSFNLGGTVSGRLSSSDPNMQNLPSGSTYGKLIKSCFMAPKGWVFCGADFSSLEDRINALLTKDPEKLKVYTDGYDSHSLRAYAYFKDDMPEIRQAESHERCFKIKIDNNILLCKSGDFIIMPDGNKMLIEDYYDSNQRL